MAGFIDEAPTSAGELWDHLTSRNESLEPRDLAIALAVAVLVRWAPLTRRAVSYVVTLVHELGHMGATRLTGGSIDSIRLERDGSGLTMSRHTGPFARFVTLASGYPAPGLVAVVAAAAVGAGWARATAAVAAVVLLAAATQARSVLAAAVFAASIAALGAGAVWVEPSALAIALTGLAITLAFGGVTDSLGLFRVRRSGIRHDDASTLARLTRIPASVWVLCFVVVSLTELAAGAWLLVRP
ncbi:MAG: M50 family metallopeptidase [Actinomycetota bacterium]|nr:M50 family metallopeptidase [Actinomycetota bacterium]